MIKIRNLKKIYANDGVETMALNSISLDIHEGEYVAIQGPPGCGKSTLMNLIGLLDSPSEGEYRFMGKDVSNCSPDELESLRKENIGFIFQHFGLIDDLTVWENIELPLLYLKMPNSLRKKKIEEAMDRMNILHRRKHFPKQLSELQQQRAAMARVIVTNPKLIMADEPTGHIDSAKGEELMKILDQLNDEGVTIVTRANSSYVAHYAHRAINLFEGKIISENIKEQFHI
jgi:putative ABC transport system ATP-binding protein